MAADEFEGAAGLPDPGDAGSLDQLVERLQSLKIWAGNPSYDVITARVNARWAASGRPESELARRGTVVDCFRTGRRRINTELVIAVVESLHADTGYSAQWRQALRVVTAEAHAAAQVRVQDTLPDDLPEFTGRGTELDRLREALTRAAIDGTAVVISTIAGMAGVGKTRLAIHAGHLLAAAEPFDQVLFVNLRGFHPDPAQPPADPGAVLESFLRLLGVPGVQIPRDLASRSALFRRRLAGRRALVVLDDAADEEQVGPLLPASPGCLTLVTSRRNLDGLRAASHVPVDVFDEDEAVRYLKEAVPAAPIDDEPDATARVIRRCGRLPLALALVAGHMRARPGWTVTDHADRLDERHRDRRLDAGVELALGVSYQHVPGDRRRMLRLLSLHPGHDIEPYAAAALAGVTVDAARTHLRRLAAENLLQQAAPDRFVFHDLVRAFAASRASDEDPSTERRAALTRLLDYYVGTAAIAMDTLHPAEKHRRADVARPATDTPGLATPDAALAWLDTERPTLVAIAAHAAGHGWLTHVSQLSSVLFRYLNSGYHTDAAAVHGSAAAAARQAGDDAGQADALINLGASDFRLGQADLAADRFQQALRLLRPGDHPTLQARALTNLSQIEIRTGRYRAAADHFEQSLDLHRQAGDHIGQIRALGGLGILEVLLGRYLQAAEHHEQALALSRETGNRSAESYVLNNLAHVEVRLGRYDSAAAHLELGLTLCRQIGNRTGEGAVLDCLGLLHTQLGRPDQAADSHRQALAVFREAGDREGDVWALNGLGEAAYAAGRPAEAVTHHTAALDIAVEVRDRDQQARAHTGLGHARRALGDPGAAREHYQQALDSYADLGAPEADQLRALLKEPDRAG